MRYCQECKVSVNGDWLNCPLCHQPLEKVSEIPTPNPYPDIPLRFNKQQVLRILTSISIATISISLIIELFFLNSTRGLNIISFGIVSMWLVVLIIIRKRRNIAKSIVYLIISLSLLSIYWDYVEGWSAWSTTHAVPMICIFALIAMYIAVRLVKVEVEDYILYLLCAALIGLIPAVFLFFDWVTNPLPAWLSIGLSTVMLIVNFIFYRAEVLRELKKRMMV
ncbi:hypothetical protein SAMN05878443_0018 [Carnobacterium alterfunditum]|uniref:Uncharacterized protein n=1 Tax=Carnobacterium alterfunditum TaxID=28230 RepID=A0A1N6EIX3_9LACT|nr:DUF6320 domain-containing protein [Carnobacterium alterfunditum]SIN82996.1 hypothetical protein SAMN05878443_0018 [Carnobacterium alterfunditum]